MSDIDKPGAHRRNRVTELHFYEWRLLSWATSQTRDRLDAAGRGIYRELLDQCYAQGGFPDDREYAIRKCACTSEEYERTWQIIRSCFVHDARRGEFHNRAADIYRREYFSYIESQRRKGKTGGRPASRKPNGINDEESSGLADGSDIEKPVLKQKPKPIQEKRREEKTIQEILVSDSADTPQPLDAIDAKPKPQSFAAHGYVVPMERSMFDEIAARMYKRHAKKDGKILFEQALACVLADAGDNAATVAQSIEAAHEKQCEYWKSNYTGPSFWPKLADWVRDGKYLDDVADNRAPVAVVRGGGQPVTFAERNEEIRRQKFAARMREDLNIA